MTGTQDWKLNKSILIFGLFVNKMMIWCWCIIWLRQGEDVMASQRQTVDGSEDNRRTNPSNTKEGRVDKWSEKHEYSLVLLLERFLILYWSKLTQSFQDRNRLMVKVVVSPMGKFLERLRDGHRYFAFPCFFLEIMSATKPASAIMIPCSCPCFL